MKLPVALAALFLALPLAAQTGAAPAPKPDWNAAGAAWWAHVEYLASDQLQGRLPGTPGFALATRYVVDQFRKAGLQPAGSDPHGPDGFLQPVNFTSVRLDLSHSHVELETGGKHNELTPGKDITLLPNTGGNGPVEAPLVFVGYGLRLPTRHIDDLAGLDLHGKIAVFYNGAPARVQGPQRAYARMPAERWKVLHAAGAVGWVAIAPPRPGAPPPSANARAPRPIITFTDPAMNPLPQLRVNASMTPAQAEALLVPTGHSMAQLQPLIDAGKPLPAFALNATLHVSAATTPDRTIDTQNIVGELPGSDPALRKEFIVISAHLDHLGVGPAVNGDTIYNGAMDNASGIASLIETAKLLAAGPRPKRSILFVALTGEEMGELGSSYFARRPTVPRQAIVADLNMDMYLPLFPLRYLEVQGLGESSLGNDARAVAQLNDVEVQFDKQPDENRFIRSDQVNFVAQGIPALAFKFGWTPDSPEMKIFNDWVKNRYHKPSDDLNQPVDQAAAAQFDSLLAQLATRVANDPQRPTWYPESSFAHQAQ